MSSRRNIDFAPYEYVRSVVLSRSDTSYWLRAALVDLEERDPVDAMNDLDVLKGLLERRFDELKRGQKTPPKREL